MTSLFHPVVLVNPGLSYKYQYLGKFMLHLIVCYYFGSQSDLHPRKQVSSVQTGGVTLCLVVFSFIT